MQKLSTWERYKRRSVYIWQYYTSLSLSEKAFISLFNHINFKENQHREWQFRGQHLNEYDKAREKSQSECSHRKGGYVSLKLGVFEHGTDNQYAVCKHQLPLGDWIIKCLRCGKKWTMPKRESFKTDFDFQMAYLQYTEAKNFPTNNTSSTGIQFQKFEKKSLWATLNIVWAILKRDITLWSSLRDNPECVTMRLT